MLCIGENDGGQFTEIRVFFQSFQRSLLKDLVRLILHLDTFWHLPWMTMHFQCCRRWILRVKIAQRHLAPQQ